MKAAVVTAGMAASITLGCVKAAHAATINTASSWDGSSLITPFGETDTATYGQTFTVGADNVLQSFSFFLGGFESEAVDFAAYVMGWDGAQAEGSILYQSTKQTKDSNSSFEEFTFNTGGINLTSGQQYVAFLSASNFFDGILGTTGMGYLDSDVYSGGGFVFRNNGSDFSLLTSTPWETFIGNGVDDTAFKASFTSSAAIPTPALLPGLIGMGVATLRKRKGEALAEASEES